MLLLNYIKLAWRNLGKRKLYSFINIGGLAAGLCVCMLIMLYVAHELSYDRFHKDSARIFSLLERIKMENDTIQMDRFNYASAPAVRQQSPGVESFLRMGSLLQETTVLQRVDNPSIRDEEAAVWFTDANYFRFFSFPLLQGQPDEVLKQPFTMVLSVDMAKKYFGNTDVVGKQLRFNGEYLFQITGVMANTPSNSSLKADFLLSGASMSSMTSMKELVTTAGGFAGAFLTFLKLDDASHQDQVTRNIDQLLVAQQDPGKSVLMPLASMHRESRFSAGFNLRYLSLFPLVATLILLMALINYMSLSTARATVRAREIGVRKALGADHKHIAQQFYVESALYAFLAFCLGLLLCFILRPWFFNLLQLKVDMTFLYHPVVLGIYSALLLITILIAGSYPSFVLSRYNPVTVLSGKMSKGNGGATVRKVLTVLQFATAAVLIICSIVINRQLFFFRHTDTGINKENVLMLPFRSSIAGHYQSYRQQVAALNGVTQTGTGRYSLFGDYDIWFVPREDVHQPMFSLNVLSVDTSLLGMMGLQWKIPPADMAQLGTPGTIVLNEEAVKGFGFPGSPIGKQFRMGPAEAKVIGVLKNFHFKSLHAAITPLALKVEKDNSALWGAGSPGCLFVKIAPRQNIPALIAQISKIYSVYDTQTPFQYTFLDDAFAKMYTAEDRLAGIFGGFTALTVLISALGLLGLAAFSAEQRTREIGVRKVLGASVVQITTLLSKEFIRLVFMALVIASPIAWYLMRGWLQQFAYRIHLQPWMFVLSAFIAVATAAMAIGLQTVRAAVRNPVTALKVE
ncbi:ABC transporter permease [Chitinophaga arvensicola]|uniref:Putative ABC transport system permease protein n=1 Tax=Chitinophaga arvensicola TaxID=29529 RepID=A0A1I0NWY0_9BACT|nr:ABC transporter permease [Chitinophaga arvensicola]SEW06146.1 putative ABC transport system permease protein [Chitinophaga arvensicola]